ncbi:HpcH/HpaI aldolase family protein [Castellaniella defragrans]|uniref:4-hydroxy-2-oxoheptanedioate aldolase n=1 Tax=Castellaniella defragrans TaxID=75697 RepID=A0A7W9TN40_CASDE|nr:HpcH/HpaI aldolase/citrate lyase family protein [Castellaniella defragrans]KAB0621243.1 HpcH/HpaI aldolase/citrate lyase family protein [Castellaniella defragrans]MBB6083775.1 4-hydroxy-2-oxoheptanedioate aldolase [Castellaniella defragrans]
MAALHNSFKAALRGDPVPRIGLFMGLCDPGVAELLGDTGLDWLLIDGEHGPNDLRTVLAQLRALEACRADVLVRIVDHDPALIKQMLDIGVQSLLVPMVESAEQARALVRATRYPPAGIRGVGSALARAARWNGVPDYLKRADDEICLIVQAESRASLDALDDILTVEGVDAVFIGPSDLAASMGHLGQPEHPEVRAAVLGALEKVVRSGKAAGVFATRLDTARLYCQAGARFVALGTDTLLLRQSAAGLVQAFHAGAAQAAGAGY